MAIVKSNILKKLKEDWPNIPLKDLEKVTDIILNEIKFALKRGERVELRGGLGVFYTKVQKARISRNPASGQKIDTPEKITIKFKASRDLFKKLNNEKK